jgi:general secretion pathway protein H
MNPTAPRPHRHTGFTMIEVLLVVLLVGVVSGLVLLAASPSDSGRLAIGEADRLEEAVSLAMDTAVSDNEQYGLLQTEDGYQFLVFDDATAEWLPSDNPAFTAYTLPPDIHLEIQPLESGNKGGEAARPMQTRKTQEALLPQVMLLSSGESTAATLAISTEKTAPEKLVLDDIGNLRRNPDAPRENTDD